MKIHNQISKGSAMSSFITMRHGIGKSGFGGRTGKQEVWVRKGVQGKVLRVRKACGVPAPGGGLRSRLCIVQGPNCKQQERGRRCIRDGKREGEKSISVRDRGDERETLCQVGIGTCLIPTHAQWRVTGQVHAPRQAATTMRGLGKTGAGHHSYLNFQPCKKNSR